MTTEERFFNKIELIPFHTCWEWIGARHSPIGYGSFQKTKAHRFSYELHKGAIPTGLCVMHTCDNTMCVNPEHLVLGTHQENMIDRNKKGRQACLKGILNGNSKLTNSEVISIRKEYSNKESSLNGLAKKFKVSKKLVLNIIKHRAWKHL